MVSFTVYGNDTGTQRARPACAAHAGGEGFFFATCGGLARLQSDESERRARPMRLLFHEGRQRRGKLSHLSRIYHGGGCNRRTYRPNPSHGPTFFAAHGDRGNTPEFQAWSAAA